MPKITRFLGDKQYLLGNDICMTDFVLFELIETLVSLAQSDRVYIDFPTLKAYHDRIAALPTLHAYLISEKHIKTPFFAPFIKVQML